MFNCHLSNHVDFRSALLFKMTIRRIDGHRDKLLLLARLLLPLLLLLPVIVGGCSSHDFRQIGYRKNVHI